MSSAEFIDNKLPSILVVDDEQSSLLIMQKMLDGLGEIYTANSGQQALEKAHQVKPMVALLDIEMDDINGIELCTRLKANPVTQDIAIIFVTSHAESQIEYEALNSGGIDFLSKPLNGPLCRLRVKNHIELKQYNEAFKAAQAHAEKEREHLRITLNSIGDGVIATDNNGVVTFMNPVAEQMTGWLTKHAVTHKIEDIMTLRDAETKYPVINPIRLALEQERTVGLALNCQLKSRDGKIYRVEDSASPIKHGEKIIGAIIVFHDISEAVAMSVKMNHISNHDQLTDLPNRILLHDRITQSLNIANANNSITALLLIDIDRFMYLNDSAGHYLGDKIIQLIAKRLTKFLTASNTVARVGGDEFVLLIPNINDYTEVDIIAAKIIETFRQPFLLEDKEYKLTASLGISLYPIDSSSEETMMRHADVAMFRAKEQGRDQYCFFSEELETELVNRHSIEVALRKAIETNSLEVHFQSQIEMASKKVVAAEALVRLKNQGQYLSPLIFIPLAEDMGLINKLGYQVLVKSCQAAQHWHELGFPIKVTVNIAAKQFTNPDFYDEVLAVLEQTKLASRYLELEVTESALMYDFDETKLLLDKFRTAGISIAIDDFGTGYSSLSYLKFFDVNILKIDQSFVFDMLKNKQNLSIVKAIINLAKALDLIIIAEGIETAAHAKALTELGCHIGQGYFYSKPIPNDDFERYLFAQQQMTLTNEKQV